MMRAAFIGLFCIFAGFSAAGCGSSPSSAPREAAVPAIQEDQLPVLEQNQVPSFSTVSADYSEVQIFEDHDDEHQKVSEEERKLVFPAATD